MSPVQGLSCHLILGAFALHIWQKNTRDTTIPVEALALQDFIEHGAQSIAWPGLLPPCCKPHLTVQHPELPALLCRMRYKRPCHISCIYSGTGSGQNVQCSVCSSSSGSESGTHAAGSVRMRLDPGCAAQVWRFYLLSNRPETADSDFKWSDFVAKNNAELLGNLGNFVHRALSFTHSKWAPPRLRPVTPAPSAVGSMLTARILHVQTQVLRWTSP